MMYIQPTDLRYFFEAAQTENLSRAAERLGIGQPALSQSIQRLEHILGAKVFDRYKTGVRLTPVGRRLMKEGQTLLDDWGKLKSLATETNEGIQGQYSIGCHPSVGLYSLHTFLPQLLSTHPQLEISLRHGLSREIFEDVVSFRIDFGLVMNPVSHPDLVIQQLCEDRVSFYWKPSGNAQVLIYDPALMQSHELIKKFKNKKMFSRFLTSGSLENIARLAEAGCGVAVLPERIAQLQPSLKLFSKDLPHVVDKLCLIYRADRTMNEAGKTIIKQIRGARI